jgi:hypothetical protein
MTHKGITLEFVVPTVLAIALGISCSIGAVYLTDKYLGPVDQAEANRSLAGSRETRAKVRPRSGRRKVSEPNSTKRAGVIEAGQGLAPAFR